MARVVQRLSALAARAAVALVVSATVFTGTALAQSPELYGAMEWRFAGPYYGGRVTAVTGIPSKPFTFYMGATGGGVWKSENAGQTWTNLSDEHFKTGTVGAIAVSLSDPNVVYVGMGESPIRGVTTSHGDGVYKSTDAGKTWTHIGLEATRQISRVQVHHTNPDIVYVAAQGNPWGANPERGVYRSLDGGKNWEAVLQVGPETGAVDLVMDPTNPRILYAAMWEHRRSPWFIKSGGPGSGIYKSVDGGSTWQKLEKGLPDLIGKVGLSVARTDPDRVYAIVEAEDGGLYRSDDGGESWSLQNDTRVIQARSWYYHDVLADPTDANTVYVMNVPLMKSLDGGKTFSAISTPHSDHHDHWINPDNANIQISGNDGGAAVTLDGGETWSPYTNQPTAQFYRVETDNLFPYYLYAGQQDFPTIAIPSQTMGGGIGAEHTYSVGGGESAHIAFNPDDPTLIYATSINGLLTEYNLDLKTIRPIRPYPEYVFGRDSKDHKFRTNWNAPVEVSLHDPNVIYYGTQYLMRSIDRGTTWEVISPDLTRNEPEKQGQNGGPITNEQAGAEFYNTVFYIAESPHEGGTIYVGSDDGLVHLTQDGGRSWRNVTPRAVSEAQINAIEVSPHDATKAYIAVAGYKLNDFTPQIYRTTNNGSSWRKITKGLPDDTFVRVVREDPEHAGLLYAGTEAGMFVSFDDGANWQSLQLELPPVPITDLKIRQGDLVAATQGRGFWILDDLGPLRQIAAGDIDDIHLFTPSTALRLGRGSDREGPKGDNPPRGAVIYYYLKDKPGEGTDVTLEILDADNRLVRRFTPEKTERDACVIENTEPRNRSPFKGMPVDKGQNRWVWDLRRDGLPCVEGIRLFNGWYGARVVPGTYIARLTVGDTVRTASFEVAPDPRIDRLPSAYDDLERYLSGASDLMSDVLISIRRLRAVRAQINTLIDLTEAHDNASEIEETGASIVADLTAWEETVTQPKHFTYDDDINWPNNFDVQALFLIRVLDSGDIPVGAGAKERFSDLQTRWSGHKSALAAILEDRLAAFNARLRELDAGAIYIP